MRKIFFVCAFLLAATTCHAGTVIIQQNNCIGPRPGTQYQVSCAFTNPNQAGDGIVVITIGDGIQYPSCGPLGGLPTGGDTNGNTYGSAGQGLGFEDTSQSTGWVAFNIAAGSNTVTFACNSFDYISVYIYEVQGAVGQPNLVDQFATTPGAFTTTDTASSGSITTTQNNEIIFAVFFEFTNFSTVGATGWSDSAGWTNPVAHNDPQDGVTTMSSHVVTMIVTSTGTYSDTGTFTGGSIPTTSTVGFIASFSFGSSQCTR
jgi:hypothetical protein